jgi:hypothetical protein
MTNVFERFVAPRMPGDFNVSVVSSDPDLDGLTRKGTLIASHLVLAHDESAPLHRVDRHVLGTRRDASEPTYYIQCPDLERLGRWLSDVVPLLDSGAITYMPRVQRKFEYGPPFKPVFRSTDWELLLANGRLTQAVDSVGLGGRTMIRLLDVDIPVLENVGLHDLASILTEEVDAHEVFRGFLRRRLIELDAVTDPRDLERKSVVLGIDLQDGLREVAAELKQISRRNAVQVTGATLAFASASLVAVSGPSLAPLVAVLGAGGGAVTLAGAVNGFGGDLAKARSRPFYFLWLLQRHSRKA